MKNLLWLPLLFLASCKSVYIPNARNSPMFSSAGEIQLSASGGVGDFDRGSSASASGKTYDLDVQSAFSVSDHVGFMGNYSVTNLMDAYQHHWFGEAGVGYYDNAGKVAFEIFSGFGKGYGITAYKDKYSGQQGLGETDYGRFFIQPAFAWNKTEHHISIISRLSFVRFSNYGILRKPLFVVFFEPAVTGKVNFFRNHAYMQWQVGISIDGSENYPGIYLDDMPLNVNIGLGGRIGVFGRKNK